MGSECDAVSPFRPPPFVEVYIADGTYRRFAAGTKAGFAVDSINCKGAAEASFKKYTFIESVKEGEEAVEFGPDAELVVYGEGWKLQAVQDARFLKAVSFGVSKVEAKDELKAVNRPVTNAFNPADYYPGGKLPEGKPPKAGLAYCWNVSVVIGILFSVGGLLAFLLEYLGGSDSLQSPGQSQVNLQHIFSHLLRQDE